jgi:hypothetical protein
MSKKRTMSTTSTASTSAEAKRQKSSDRLETNVAYITLPPKKCQDNCAVQAIRRAKRAGAHVINIVFAKDSDIDDLWDDLNTEFKGSAEQPALLYRINGPLMTLFSEKCGVLVDERHILVGEKLFAEKRGELASLCMTFTGPMGRMTILNALIEKPWQTLPSYARERILAAYTSAAEDCESTIKTIGGRLASGSRLPPIERSWEKHKSKDDDLFVLSKIVSPMYQRCFPLESSGAAILMIHLRRGSGSDY